MSMSVAEPGQSTGIPSSQTGRTWGEKLLVAIGMVSLLAGAIEAALKGLGGALKALGGVFTETKSLSEALNLHGPIAWAAPLSLVIAGAWLLYLGNRKRSRLLRPEALTLRANEPAHLRGRDDDLKRLAGLCRDFPLVFLVGESGAGKSAVVRSGLCQPGTGPLPASMVPVLVDGWGDDWSNGPARRLAEAIQTTPALTEDDRARLALTPCATLASLLAAVKRFKTKLGRTPLLVLDQFDDYQVRHRDRFRDPETGAWKAAPSVAKENAFWKGMGVLLQSQSAHLLIVTRSDTAAGLISVQLVEKPATYPLDGLSASVVKPLLDDLTRADPARGPVVADPENGWEQLKVRLARDLEQDRQVLPIQLRTALAGLTALPTLTIAAYQRAGGVQGLQAGAVDQLVASAGRHSGLDRAQVIRALVGLVDVRAQKTIPKPTATLAEIARVEVAPLNKAMETLEARELVRRAPAADHADVSWRLDHDYWSGAVIEVERRLDRWNSLLRNAHQTWREAHGDLRKRWRALLPPRQQLALLWQRCLGRLRYGPAWKFALLSTLRWLPYAAVLLVGLSVYHWDRDRRDAARAETLFAEMREDDYEVTPSEMRRCLWPLALANENVRWHFLTIGLEDPDSATRLRSRVEFAAQSTVQTDIQLRERVINKLIIPMLSQKKLNTDVLLSCAGLGQTLYAADDHKEYAAAVTRAFVKAIEQETDYQRLNTLLSEFAKVIRHATPEQAVAVARRLVRFESKAEFDPSRVPLKVGYS